MLAIFTDGRMHQLSLHSSDLSQLKLQPEPARANILSSQHVPWTWIDLVSEAAKKSPTNDVYSASSSLPGTGRVRTIRSIPSPGTGHAAPSPQRSGHGRQEQHAPGQLLCHFEATMPKASPFGLLPWKPCVHPVIFVHRVEGLEKGLYILLAGRRAKRGS